MSNKYDDIDYCLNLLYDFVYGKSTKWCVAAEDHNFNRKN